MLNLNEQDIKRIADELDCGFRCYIHGETGEIITVPDELKHPDMDTEAWTEEKEKLETNFNSYFEIEQLQSRDGFDIMVDFTEQLQGNDRLKSELIRALNKKHSFRNFKFLIDNSGEYRQQWFDFKNSRLIEWVKHQLDRRKLPLTEHGGS